MFNDVVEVMTLVLNQIKDKPIKQNPEPIVDLYIQLNKLYVEMSIIVVHLSRDKDKYYINRLDDTPRAKWTSVLNET